MMYKLKQILRLIQTDFTVWIKNPRIIATLMLAFMMCIFVTQPLVQFAREQEVSLNAVEPFLSIFSDSTAVFLVMIGSVLLFCDAPFAGIEQPFFIMRTGRRTWIFSKLMFIIITSAFYTGLLLLISAMLSWSRSYVANIWSDNTYAIWTNLELADIMGIMRISSDTIQYLSPFTATVHVFLLGTLYSASMGCIVLVFNLFTKKAFGIFTALLVHAFGYALSLLGSVGRVWSSNIGFLSLMIHVDLSAHRFTNIFSWGRPTFAASYLLFILIIIGCAVVSEVRVKCYSLYFCEQT